MPTRFPTRIRLARVPALVLLAAFTAPTAAEAQSELPRRLTLEESEAYQMSTELLFGCSPYRHRRAEGSQSTVRRATDALSGTAVHFSSVEGTYLVLERYDEELNGHCLVIGWFGGPLVPGRHTVGRLAMSAIEEEVDAGDHAFYGMSMVRTSEESSVFVVESGVLDIASMEGGTVTGTFELSGFLVDDDGANRIADVDWSGSFVALEGAD